MNNFYEGGRAVPRLTREILFTLLCLLICGLFSVALAQSRDSLGTLPKVSKPVFDFTLYDAVEVRPITRVSQIEREKRVYAKVDFTKLPMEMFKIDKDKIPKLQIGEKLPDMVLDMPLRVVNDTYARDTITLRECMDRTWIILDIWNETCTPCIPSMNKWEELSKTDTSFTLLGLYSSHNIHRAMPESRKKGYTSSQVISSGMLMLSHIFMHDRNTLGPSIWIKHGRFFGVSEANTLKEEDYRLLLDGKLDSIPDYAVWKPTTH